jgi:hypothetical protein
VIPGVCLAQTVGDVTSKGGQQLGPAEVKQIFAAPVVMKGKAANSEFKFAHKTDGTFSGEANWAAGTLPLSGTWNINDKGQYCATVIQPSAPARETCMFLYKSGDEYFAAPDNEPTTVARVRSFEK